MLLAGEGQRITMIIDGFMFYNEHDILKGRLEYLYDTVDYFILVEAPITFSGNPKPMNFLRNMSKYKKYLDKIIYTPLICKRSDFEYHKQPKHELDHDTGPWQCEYAHRDHIATVLGLFSPDDIIMISDLDEIPNKEAIPPVIEELSKGVKAVTTLQTVFVNNLTYGTGNHWRGTVITTNKHAQEVTPNGLRYQKKSHHYISNGGWHLTYWGDVKFIQNKIRTFAHQELNTDYFKNEERLKRMISTGRDLFERSFALQGHQLSKLSDFPTDFLRAFGPIHNKIVQAIFNETPSSNSTSSRV